MPSNVREHQSHSRRGTPYHVRNFTRDGPEHSQKWKRLVRDLKREPDVEDPYAVATARLGRQSFKGRSATDPPKGKRTFSERLLRRPAGENARRRRAKDEQRALKERAKGLREEARALRLEAREVKARERERRANQRARSYAQ